MPSGYEKSPDYGGPESKWPAVIVWGVWAVSICVVAGMLAYLFSLMRP